MEIFDDDFITEAHDRAVREEGRAEGARNNAVDTAEALFRNGVSIDIVAKSIPILTFDEVRAIEAGMLQPV